MKKKTAIIKKVLAATLALSVTAGCAVLAPVIIPSADNAVVNAAEENELQFQSNGDGTVEVSWASGYNKEEVVIPAYFNGCKVTGLGSEAFYSNNTIKKVTLPDTIKWIGDEAFANCYNLSSINIPSSVTHIGNKAFSNTAIKSITIPSSVKVIDEAAFMSSSLSGITLSEGIEVLGDEVFEGTSLVSVTIPDSVTQMGMAVFSFCQSLKSVTLGKGLTEIPENTFNYCNSLENVVIPDSITAIRRCAFADCTALSSLNVPDSVYSVGEYAFSETNLYDSSKDEVYIGKVLYKYNGDKETYTIKDGTVGIATDALSGSPSIKTLNIPDSVKWIEENAIYLNGCLENINGGNGLIYVGWLGISQSPWYTSKEAAGEDMYIGSVLYKAAKKSRVLVKAGTLGIATGAFEYNDKLTYVRLSNSLKTIGKRAFQDTIALKEITLPSKLEYIGEDAFFYSGIQSITIPDKVTYIGPYAFNGSDISELTLPPKMKKINESAFSNMDKIKVINIPEGVTYIGSYAFANCPDLEEINLPKTLRIIEDHAFCCFYPRNSENYISSVTVPANVVFIGEEAIGHWFYGNTNTYIFGKAGTEAERYAYVNGLVFNGIYILYDINDVGSVQTPAKFRFKMSSNYGEGYSVYYRRKGAKNWILIGTGDGCTASFSRQGDFELKVVTADNSYEYTSDLYVMEAYLENTSTLSADAVNAGTKVTINGAATGGTGSYTYTYYYARRDSKSWKTLAENTTATAVSFTPKTAGLYDVRILVSDTVPYNEIEKTITLYVYSGEELQNTSTVSSQSVTSGTRVTINGSAAGGTTVYSYAYYYKKSTSSVWKNINSGSYEYGNDFGSKTSVYFKPTSAGTYNVRAVVRDADGKEINKDFNITVS